MRSKLTPDAVAEDSQKTRAHVGKDCHPLAGIAEHPRTTNTAFFGRLKNQMFFSRDWLSTTIEFVAAVDAYIRWYMDARIKNSLGFRSPTEHRRSLGIAA